MFRIADYINMSLQKSLVDVELERALTSNHSDWIHLIFLNYFMKILDSRITFLPPNILSSYPTHLICLWLIFFLHDIHLLLVSIISHVQNYTDPYLSPFSYVCKHASHPSSSRSIGFWCAFKVDHALSAFPLTWQLFIRFEMLLQVAMCLSMAYLERE